MKDLRFVITPSKRGGYSITSVDETQMLIEESEHLTFLHKGRWIGFANTLSFAYLATKHTLYCYGY